MFSLIQMDNRFQNSPPLRLVSMSINDLQREPKLYRITFSFCDPRASVLSSMSHTTLRNALQAFFQRLATQVAGPA